MREVSRLFTQSLSMALAPVESMTVQVYVMVRQ